MPSSPPLADLFEQAWRGHALSLHDLSSRREIGRIPLLRHPLGFLHTVIERDMDYAMRLHIWTESKRPYQYPFWPIHSHRFNLVSSILCGSLKNRLYSVLPSEANPTHRLYRVQYIEGTSNLHPTERLVNLTESGSHTVRARESYVISAGQYHQSDVAPDCFAATLALTRDVLQAESIFTAGEIAAAQAHEYDRSPLNANESAAVIERLMENCSR